MNFWGPARFQRLTVTFRECILFVGGMMIWWSSLMCVCVWDVRVCLGFDVCFFWMIMDVFSSIHILLLVLTCAFYTIYTLQHFNFIVVLSWRGKIQTQVFLRKKVAEAMSFEVFNMHVWHCLLGSSRFKIGAFALVYVVVVPTPCLWEFDWRQIHIHVHISLHIFTYCVYFFEIYTYIRFFICTS